MAVLATAFTAGRPARAQSAITPAAPTSAPAQAGGATVLFERHATAPGMDTEPTENPSPTPAPAIAAAPVLKRRASGISSSTAAESAPPPTQDAAAQRVDPTLRSHLRITSTDMDLHLDQHTAEVNAHARLTVTNTGATSAREVALQISSALSWTGVRVAAARSGSSQTSTPFEQHRLVTDLDHTGAANEAVVTLASPLAPGASVVLDTFYGGTFHRSAERLLRIGAPPDEAEAADWDMVMDSFTGLRGLGNVLWYPAIAPPAFLGSGETFTRAVDSDRAANANSAFHLRLTVLYTGNRPDAAFFCGERMPLEGFAADAPASAAGSGSSSSSSSVSSGPDSTVDANSGAADEGVAVAEWTRAALDFHIPSLFVAEGGPQEEADHLLRAVTEHADTAAVYGDALAMARPVVADWLGASPRRPLDVLDLPVADGATFEDGSLLVTPMRSVDPAQLARAMAYALPALWLPERGTLPWLSEGLAEFARAMYVESTSGRDAALAELAAGGDQLAELEVFTHPGGNVSSPAKGPNDVQGDPIPGVLAGRAAQPHADAASTSISTAVPLSRCDDPACARTKAAYVFEMLRTLVGDAALKQALSGMLQDAGRNGGTGQTADFERLLMAASGKNLDWFFHDWIDGDPGLPELQIVTVAPRRVERAAPAEVLPERKAYGGPIGPLPVPQANGNHEGGADSPTAASPNDPVPPVPGSWLVAVEVRNQGGADATVPVTVRSGSLINTLPLHVPAHGVATVRVPFEADPREVTVNDGSVPEIRTSTHRLTIRNLDQ